MADDTGGAAAAYDPMRVATPLQLLQLMHRLDVPGRVIARQLGVTPAAISMWLNEKRPIPAVYTPRLRLWAQKALDEAAALNQKEVTRQPTAALRQLVQDAFTGLWARWQGEVLYEAGTLHAAILRQYDAIGGWVRQERYRADDIESVRLASEDLVHLMARALTLQGEIPSAEDELVARLAAAHDAAAPIVLTPEERAKAEADMPAVLPPEP
jgi:hypothetical protein